MTKAFVKPMLFALAAIIIAVALPVTASAQMSWSNYFASDVTEGYTLAPGSQHCFSYIFGAASYASASLKYGNTYVSGKLTIWDETAGVRLARVDGTSLATGVVYSVSGDNAYLTSCVTNTSAYTATWQHSFGVGTLP